MFSTQTSWMGREALSHQIYPHPPTGSYVPSCALTSHADNGDSVKLLRGFGYLYGSVGGEARLTKCSMEVCHPRISRGPLVEFGGQH